MQESIVAVKEVMILSVLGTQPAQRLTEANLTELVSELDAYAKQSLDRIYDGPDRPSRVLRTDIRSLLDKHKRLFADVERLALRVLSIECVKAVFPLTESDVRARLSLLRDAFLQLLERADNKNGK